MNTTEKKRKFQMPHVFVILFAIMLLVTILSYLIPSGMFERTTTESGQELVNPDRFEFIKQENPIGFVEFFTAIHTGFVEASTIIGSLLICSGCLGIFNSTGTLTGSIQKLSRAVNGRNTIVILIFFIYFAGMNIMGAGEAVYPFFPIVTSIIVSLGYDKMMGAATIMYAATAGFACGMVNLFTTGISQQIVGLPMFSGIGYRFIVFIVLAAIGLTSVLRYGSRILKDPSKSIVAEEYREQLARLEAGEPVEGMDMGASEFTMKHKLCISIFILLIIVQAYGCLKLGFALGQIAGLYVVFAIIVCIIFRISPNDFCGRFVEGVKPVIAAAFAIGLARSVMVLLDQGQIMDTLVYYMGNALTGKPIIITLLLLFMFVTAFNFLVVSGSGKAVMMMPIMSPLGKMLGINQQVMVLTYQLGDGLTNMLWPGGGLIACSLCGVNYGDWLKMAWKTFGLMLLCGFILIVIANAIGYGPF